VKLFNRKHSNEKAVFFGIEKDDTFYSKTYFHHLLRIERLRTERSQKPFLLILLDFSDLIADRPGKEIPEKINSALLSALRETDIRGWYDPGAVIGVIFSEIASPDQSTVQAIVNKIYRRMHETISEDLIRKIKVSFHLYPEPCDKESVDGPFNITLYPDLAKSGEGRRFALMVKAAIDFIGSAAALLLLFPVLLITALAVKWTSEGPVLFKQDRLGYNGVPFRLFKFRSMYADVDQRKHQEYIQKYIQEQENAAVTPGVFKLNEDSRVTPVGKFIRKMSIDELPQLINVFKGDMSLVGPRPPIAYECDLYNTWHKRRLLLCKPGITGLWQVTGRSRTTFDDMVRLDLQYIREWSLWLDIRLLLKTPWVILTGRGAY
jgi:lipopolysaccharide/colanic/teichoic acid biosynthesis glycosyltransferase